MGKGLRGKSFPHEACSTVGGALKTERAIRAGCMSCDHRYIIPTEVLQAFCNAYGPEYKLDGRRYRCSKCGGWMRLNFQEGGMWWPLWEEKDGARWDAKDRAARQSG